MRSVRKSTASQAAEEGVNAVEDGVGEGSSEDTGEGRGACEPVLAGTRTRRLLDTPPYALLQPLAYSFLHVNMLQHLARLNTQNLRLWFNKQFDDLMNLKKREVGLVQDRNTRLRFIIEELNTLSNLRGSFHHLNIEIKDPEWRQEEQPHKLIKVEPEECSIPPYVSPSQMSVAPPAAGGPDEFRERALMYMMDGVLEKLWHEEIKKPVPMPQCMLEKDPEHFNEDDLRLVFDYEAKVAFRNEEREKYRKMLHAEYAKLSQLLNEGIVKFNLKVKDTWLLKLRVDSIISQENLILMRLRRTNLDRIEMAEHTEEIRNNIAKYEAEVEQLQKEIQLIQEQSEECQASYDALAQKDRHMDKTFKNHFADLSPIIVDQCYKFFKKRPKWQQRASMTPGVLLQLAGAAAGGPRPPMLHPDCVDYLRACVYTLHDFVHTLDALMYTPARSVHTLTLLCTHLACSYLRRSSVTLHDLMHTPCTLFWYTLYALICTHLARSCVHTLHALEYTPCTLLLLYLHCPDYVHTSMPTPHTQDHINTYTPCTPVYPTPWDTHRLCKFRSRSALDCTEIVKGEPLRHRFGALEETHQNSRSGCLILEQLDMISNMPPVMDEALWATMCKLRRTKVENEIRMRAMVQEMAYVESGSSVWHRAVVARRTLLARQLDDAQEHRQRTELLSRNKTIQLVLPAGQVEIVTTGHLEDFEDAALIPREDIERINELILKVGNMKLNMMRKQMEYRKGILSKEWEHAQMKMKLRHMEQELYSYQRLKIPKELQLHLKNKELGYTEEHEFMRMEKETEATKVSVNKMLGDQVRRVEELELKCATLTAEADKLEKIISNLNMKVSEKRLNEDPLQPIRVRKIFKTRMETLVARSQLIREVQANHTRIVLLQTELELLRLKTYPTLATFRTVP
ncbi:unnamed protein product [Parnassius apollo]|uniref:(apollo) hypothetical protein n=1 Tax=Parnassius apollo TaxID=110799 RepID=A0A8S3WVU3_PARAO|nr:unnamed protein product [Parnassius apollo]